MKIFYAFDGKGYKGNNPPYYSLDGTGWFDKLKQQLPAIQRSVTNFLRTEGLDITSYFHVTRVDGKSWDVVPFMLWGQRNERMIEIGGEVFSYFNEIPGMVSLSVSILQPQTRIKGHAGDTDATYRMHVPIYIPSQLPDCGIKVAGVSRAWEREDVLVFNDACYHEAWNLTDEPRVVLIVDVVKKEYLSQTREIADHIMSVVLYEHYFLKNQLARLFPSVLRNAIRKFVFQNHIGRDSDMFDKLFKAKAG